MPLCSRDTIPACVICDQPTMEPGVDEAPWARDWTGDLWVCSEKCELIDRLNSSSPSSAWDAILDCAHRLGRDHADLTCVRIHRAACAPIEGVVIDYRTYPVPDVLLEDDNGDEVCVLLAMIERVEVVEDA